MTTKDDITEGFQIFTDPQRISRNLAQRVRNDQVDQRHNKATVYTNRACINNRKENAKCRARVWFGQNDPRNCSLKVPGKDQSNQVGEIAAIIMAIQNTPNFCPLEIVSDFRYIIEGLTKHLPKWEDQGWTEIKNTSLFKKAAHLLKRRSAKTTFTWVKGHRGTPGNEESNRLAKEGAESERNILLDLKIPIEFNVQGAKLAIITQVIAYQSIRKKRQEEPRLEAKEC